MNVIELSAPRVNTIYTSHSTPLERIVTRTTFEELDPELAEKITKGHAFFNVELRGGVFTHHAYNLSQRTGLLGTYSLVKNGWINNMNIPGFYDIYQDGRVRIMDEDFNSFPLKITPENADRRNTYALGKRFGIGARLELEEEPVLKYVEAYPLIIFRAAEVEDEVVGVRLNRSFRI